MAKTELAAAELIWNLISGKTGNVSKTEYAPQKPAFIPEPPAQEQAFERATPESQGIESGLLMELVAELAHDKSMDMHQLLIVRGGKVICECAYAPYKRGMWHSGYSLCKSITGMAVGMLAGEGKLKLTDRITDLLGSRKNIFSYLKMREITIENLLTMTSGAVFNEVGIISGNDWAGSFLENGTGGGTGSEFQYNSMNSYMLSAIVTELTGQSMMEYLRPRLWEPLGITRVFWESCPMGITKGGWGLFLRPEDAAKLGQLYLNDGKWQGIQVLAPEWVRQSSAKHMDTPELMSVNGYGFQMWTAGRERACNLNGMLGQNVIVYPDLDMVIVTNAGSRELFQNSRLMDIIADRFEKGKSFEVSLPENRMQQLMLSDLIARLEAGTAPRRAGLAKIRSGGWGRRNKSYSVNVPVREGLSGLDGKNYELKEQNIGLMPLLMQVLHNNYTDGIRRIGFKEDNGNLLIRIREGIKEYTLTAGLNQAVLNSVDFNSEPYLVAVRAEFAVNEDAKMVLKLDCAFIEDACRRKCKLYFDKDMVEIHWDETPGAEVIVEGLESIMIPGGKISFLMNTITKSGGMDIFRLLAVQTVHPVVTGKCWTEQNTEEE